MYNTIQDIFRNKINVMAICITNKNQKHITSFNMLLWEFDDLFDLIQCFVYCTQMSGVTNFRKIRMCSSRKYPYPPHERSFEIQRGWGIVNINIFKRKIKMCDKRIYYKSMSAKKWKENIVFASWHIISDVLNFRRITLHRRYYSSFWIYCMLVPLLQI